MPNVGEFAASAATAVFSFFLFGLVGAVFGVLPRPHGLLTTENLRSLSRYTIYLFFPAFLLATLGSTVTPDLLLSSIAMIIWAIVHLTLGLALSYGIASLVAVPEHLRAAWMLAATFYNAGSMPLLLLLPLTASPEFKRYAEEQAEEANEARLAEDDEIEPDSAEDMYARATTYIFLYTIVWYTMFWGLGYRIAEHDANAQAARRASALRTASQTGTTVSYLKNRESTTRSVENGAGASLELIDVQPRSPEEEGGPRERRRSHGPGLVEPSDAAVASSFTQPPGNTHTAAPPVVSAHEVADPPVDLDLPRSESQRPLRESTSGLHLASAGTEPGLAARSEDASSHNVAGAKAGNGALDMYTASQVAAAADTEESSTGDVQSVPPADESTVFGAVLETLYKALLTPPVVAVALGIAIGLIGPLSQALFREGGSLKIFGDVLVILGQPAIPASNVVMAGSVFHGIVAALNAFGCTYWCQARLEGCGWAPVAKQSDDGKEHGDADEGADGKDGKEGKAENLEIHPQLFVAGSVLCAWRLLGFPLIALGLYYLASLANSDVLGAADDTDPVLRMVIVTLGSVPSAQFCLMVCSQLGLARASAELALVYAVMYPLSLLTLMLFLTLGMLLVFGSG